MLAYWKSACFSEKTRTQKSPSLCGSKVEGTIRYSPGGRQKRLLTSLRLMKVSERAVEALRRKKFLLRWTFLWPWNWQRQGLVSDQTETQEIIRNVEKLWAFCLPADWRLKSTWTRPYLIRNLKQSREDKHFKLCGFVIFQLKVRLWQHLADMPLCVKGTIFPTVEVVKLQHPCQLNMLTTSCICNLPPERFPL